MIKSLLIIAVFFVGLSNSTCYNGQSKLAFAPLFRYWNSRVYDHFYTTNWDEIGQVIPGRSGKHGYVSEGITCLLVTRKMSYDGPVPLYRYFKAHDHFYTTNVADIGKTIHGQLGKYGYRSEGIVGYCYPKPTENTVPLYRYWKPNKQDHFYTTNPAEIGTTTLGKRGKNGYISEGITCYVLPFERFPK